MIKSPIIQADLKLVEAVTWQLDNATTYEVSSFKDCLWAGTKVTGLAFEGAKISQCDISIAVLKKLTLADVELDHCLLFGSNFDGAGILRTSFSQTIMSGIVLSDVSLKDVEFKDCKLDLSNFRFAKLKRVKFVNCLMKEADFQGAELKEVWFENCDLEAADWSQAKTDEVDLRSSDLTGAKGLLSLKGAKIDTGQLIGLAQTLAAEVGIVVSDED